MRPLKKKTTYKTGVAYIKLSNRENQIASASLRCIGRTHTEKKKETHVSMQVR